VVPQSCKLAEKITKKRIEAPELLVEKNEKEEKSNASFRSRREKGKDLTKRVRKLFDFHLINGSSPGRPGPLSLARGGISPTGVDGSSEALITLSHSVAHIGE